MADQGLTTHVLDAVRGGGAEGVVITLHRLNMEEADLISTATTRANGRAELLDGAAMLAGDYEITFAVGDYFRKHDTSLSDPSFFDDVTVRFIIPDDTLHYHVPLIASPWTYSTYRGGMPPKGE